MKSLHTNTSPVEEKSQIQAHDLSLVNFVNLSLSLSVVMWWLITVPQFSISVGLRVEETQSCWRKGIYSDTWYFSKAKTSSVLIPTKLDSAKSNNFKSKLCFKSNYAFLMFVGNEVLNNVSISIACDFLWRPMCKSGLLKETQADSGNDWHSFVQYRHFLINMNLAQLFPSSITYLTTLATSTQVHEHCRFWRVKHRSM